MKPKAYPYIRFSTTIQEQGDSIRRQTEKAAEFAKRNKLELDTSLELHDLGVSAYKGGNLTGGALKRFVDLVDDGTIEKGSYLILENFDRFSRMNARKAIRPFLHLVDSGINVAVIDDNKVHCDRDGSYELFAVIGSMQRAHDESERKSKLVRAAKYSAKQKVLSGERKTLWKWGTPKWLDIAEDGQGVDGTGYTINHERVKVIEKILSWVVEGRGTGYILEQLQDVEPWTSSSGINVDKKKPRQWYNSQITRIVNNPALYGERELIIKDEDGSNERTEYLANHFPAIITEDYYRKVQAARKSRDVNRDEDGKPKESHGSQRGGGRKGATITNLFQKLAVCGYSVENNASKYKCPDSNRFMGYANKDRKDTTGKVHRLRYIQCPNAKSKGSQCTGCRKLYRYEDFETAFLTHVKDVPVSTIFGSDDSKKSEVRKINEEIEELTKQFESAESQISKFEKAMVESDVISETLLKQLNKFEAVKKDIPQKIKALKSNRRVANSQHEQGGEIRNQLVDLIGEMNGCEDNKELYELRLKISELLKVMIDTIEVYNRGSFTDESVIEQKIQRYRERAASSLSSSEIEVMVDSIRKSGEQQAGKNENPYFVVKYKSGESRLIEHHPSDARSLVRNMKWDEQGSVDERFTDTTMLELKQRGVKSKDGDWRN